MKLAHVLLSQDLSSWPSGELLLHFAPVSLHCEGSWGAGNEEPGTAFADWRGRGVWKVSFLGKRVGNGAWGGGENQTKQLLFPSGSEQGVMSRWS